MVVNVKTHPNPHGSDDIFIWFIKIKIPNSKHQITNKSQIPIFNDRNIPR